MFNGKKILITGGTGSLGKALTAYLLKKYKNIKKLIIFSRDEYKQFKMQEQFNIKKNPNLRFFLGDVRDYDRLELALCDVDYVIHAAALKQVPAAEYNPFEFINTNIIGAQNIVRASIKNNIKKVIALSTDKACSPINLYGATKLCSDKLFISSNNLVGRKNETRFSVVRYGNVFASRGSVIPFFLDISKKGKKFPLTDYRMTRFNISLKKALETVIWAFYNCKGSEIVVPKLPSFKIIDLIKSIKSKPKIKIIGIRPGEKIHEELISNSDSKTSIDIGSYYLILPNIDLKKKYRKSKLLKNDFIYRSDLNKDQLSIKNLSKLIQNYSDENK